MEVLYTGRPRVRSLFGQSHPAVIPINLLCHLLSPPQKHPVMGKKLPPRYQRPSQRQQTRKKAAVKESRRATTSPSPSRVASAMALTRRGRGCGSGGKKEQSGKTAVKAGSGPTKVRGAGSKTNPTAATAVSAADRSSSSVVPSTPPPPAESIAETAKTLPPPPPPPPSQQAPPPPPPPQPSPALPKTATPTPQRDRQQQKPTSGAMFDLAAIVKARKNLKRSTFGAALGSGELTHTSDEVACLIRSGVRPEGSLTWDGAALLSQRLQHISKVVGHSDPESEGEEWD